MKLITTDKILFPRKCTRLVNFYEIDVGWDINKIGQYDIAFQSSDSWRIFLLQADYN